MKISGSVLKIVWTLINQISGSVLKVELDRQRLYEEEEYEEEKNEDENEEKIREFEFNIL